MNDQALKIEFDESNAAEAGRMAASLADYLRETSVDADVSLERVDPNRMDLGTTLSLVLAAPAAVALAKGIADWMRRQGAPKLVMVTKAGRVEVAGTLSADDKKEIILAALKANAV